MSNTLTVAGAVTLGSGMTIAGASALIVTTTATLTSNGKTWTPAMTFQGASQTYTLADNWTVNGTLTMGNGGTTTINGNNISATGSLTIASTGAVAGTTVINLTGTGTWSRSSTCVLRSSLTINTAGTITISSVGFEGATLTYTAGTVITTGSTLTISALTTTVLNTNGIIWNNIAFGTSTITLTSNLTVSGNFTPGGSSTVTINGNSVILKGSYNPSGGAAFVGTTNLVFGATGTNTWVGGTSGTLRVNTEIACGTLVLSGVCIYGTGTLLYTSGIVNSSSGTLQIQVNCTLNLNGISLTNLIIGAASVTITMASALAITTSIVATAPTLAAPSAFVSSSPGTKRVLTLSQAATQNLGYINATDMDSSQGQTFWTFKGTITTSLNWNAWVPQLKSSASI